MATQACDIKHAINDSTRSILDFLVQDKISTLQSENQALRFKASQAEQNTFITANQQAQTAELIRRLGADSPVNAYVVQPPTPVTFPVNCCGTFAGYNNYGGNGCGCGCGCNACYNPCLWTLFFGNRHSFKKNRLMLASRDQSDTNYVINLRVVVNGKFYISAKRLHKNGLLCLSANRVGNNRIELNRQTQRVIFLSSGGGFIEIYIG